MIATHFVLLLTGCRKGEILNLRWDRVDMAAGEIRSPDSKTGPRTTSLVPEAVAVLPRIPRLPDNPFVIPGRIGGKAMRNLNDPWEIVCARAGLKDVRIHDARHSFASRALALGEGLPMIGKLLGHTRVQTTARYAPPCPRYREGLRGAHRRQHRQRSRRCAISHFHLYGLYVY